MSVMDHLFCRCPHINVFWDLDEPRDSMTERALRRIRPGSLNAGAAGVSATFDTLNLSASQTTQTSAYDNIVHMCHQQQGVRDVLLGMVAFGTVSPNKVISSALWEGSASLYKLRIRLKAMKGWRKTISANSDRFLRCVDCRYSSFESVVLEKKQGRRRSPTHAND